MILDERSPDRALLGTAALPGLSNVLWKARVSKGRKTLTSLATPSHSISTTVDGTKSSR